MKIYQEFHSFYSSTLDDFNIAMQWWIEKKASREIRLRV